MATETAHFRRQSDALLFHSSVRLTAERDAATLERLREDARWRFFDEPAYLRRPALRDEVKVGHRTARERSWL